MFDLSAADVLGSDGLFVEHIDGFQCRPQQQAMAQATAQAIADYQILVAEAGTGTGKTFAYLVPALMSGHKVIISTGTKNLQDQLFHRDLPVVRKALGLPVTVALLKGRANYLCTYRLAIAEEDGRFTSREMVSQFQEVRRWAGKTATGDIAEVSTITEDAPLWPRVTSTADNCLGSDCPDFKECYVAKARREAQEAEVVVVNHHLLFADMALREDGFGELLPGANAFVIDEAHQVPEVATQFFGQSLSGRQLIELAKDSVTECHRDAGDMKGLISTAERLEYAVRDLRLAVGGEGQRRPWADVRSLPKVRAEFDNLATALEELDGHLEVAAQRGKGLEKCYERCQALRYTLSLFGEEEKAEQIYWLEVFTKTFSLNCTPLDVAEPFGKFIESRKAAWIFTSATLAVGQSFEHFQNQLGLKEVHTAKWDSPFDYRRNALLYVPKEMPAPNSEGYVEAVVEAAVPVLEASQGRAFMLFTSHRALRRAAELLAGRVDFPLLIQGSQPRTELLHKFRQSGNGVLLGTGSFWEGVDVRGEALSCVIIDKLPFAAPDDPILQARIHAIRQRGGNPFMAYQIPTSVITLKQGVGRLISDVQDRGVMMLCDPRLISKPYGRIFLDSLPPMLRTHRIDLVERFFKAQPASADSKPPGAPA